VGRLCGRPTTPSSPLGRSIVHCSSNPFRRVLSDPLDLNETGPFALEYKLIFAKSFECADAVKPYIHERFGEKSQEASYKLVHVLYEFTFFFMHLTSRIIFGKKGLGEEKGAKLQSELADLVVGPTVEAVFGHAPTDMKARMKDEFYEVTSS